MKFLNYDNVLCLSPHPDDAEYGMLGSMLKFKDTQFDIIVFSIGGEFDKSSKYFNQYDLYTTPDLRLNLGEEIDLRTYTLTAGTKIVAYELFSKEYKLINVTTDVPIIVHIFNIINVQ